MAQNLENPVGWHGGSQDVPDLIDGGGGYACRGGVVISRPESFPRQNGRILRVFAGVHIRGLHDGRGILLQFCELDLEFLDAFFLRGLRRLQFCDDPLLFSYPLFETPDGRHQLVLDIPLHAENIGTWTNGLYWYDR